MFFIVDANTQFGTTGAVSMAIVPDLTTIRVGQVISVTVTIPTTFSHNVVVTLAASSPSYLTVPATVVILAGNSSASFNVTGAGIGNSYITGNLNSLVAVSSVISILTAVDSTWNPSDNYQFTLSGLNMVASESGLNFCGVRSTASYTVGKRYFELEITGATAGLENNLFAAVIAGSAYVGLDGWGVTPYHAIGLRGNGGVFVEGATINGNPNLGGLGYPFVQGTVVGFAVDLDTGDFWIHRNGVWIGTAADPSTGTAPTGNSTYAKDYPMFSAFLTDNTVHDSSAQAMTYVPNVAGFHYSMPTGFSAWG